MSRSSTVTLAVLAVSVIASCRGSPVVENNKVEQDLSSPKITWTKTSMETNAASDVSFAKSDLRMLLLGNSQPEVTKVKSGDCSCDATSCHCCFTINIKQIHVDTTACAKIVFVTGQIGFDIELTLNGKVIFHQRVDVPNPPPLCVKMKIGSLCIDFSNLQLSPKNIHGCIKISVKVAGISVRDFDLGCFSIPPSEQKDGGMGFPEHGGQNSITFQSEIKNQEDMKFLRSIGYYGPEIKSTPHEIQDQEAMTFLRSIGYYGPEISMSENDVSDMTQVEATDCSCDDKSCQCCLRMSLKKLHLDTTGCVKIVFLTGQIGFDLELTLNGQVILHQRVDVPNPPPLCVNLKIGKLCVAFSNLQLSPKHVSGCIKISAKVMGFEVKDFDLGCFSIPPNQQKDGNMVLQTRNGQDGPELSSFGGDETVLQVADQDDSGLSLNEIKNQEVMEFLRSIGYYGPELRISENGGIQVSNDLCSCDGTSCQCCYTLKLETFHIDTTGCVKIIFQTGKAEFTIEFTLNGKAIIKETISVKDPPPLCVNIYVGTLCIDFNNLELAPDHVGGCIDISAKLWSVTIQKISLGCFRIPPSQNQPWIGLSRRQQDIVNPLPVDNHLIPVSPLSVVNPLTAETDDRRVPLGKDQDPMEFLRSIGYYGPEIRMSQNGDIQLSNDFCSCDGNTCQCCYTLNIQTLHINSKICVKIIFLTGQAGFEFQLTFNDKVFIDEKISVRDPPPLCFSVVVGSLCIEFSDLEISTDHVGGCIEISAKVMSVTIEKFKLGCFRLPPSQNQPWMGFDRRSINPLTAQSENKRISSSKDQDVMEFLRSIGYYGPILAKSQADGFGGDASGDLNSQGFKAPIPEAPVAQKNGAVKFSCTGSVPSKLSLRFSCSGTY